MRQRFFSVSILRGLLVAVVLSGLPWATLAAPGATSSPVSPAEAATTAVPGRSVASPRATVSLLSEKNSVRPGGTLWLGLQFKLAPGWHV